MYVGRSTPNISDLTVKSNFSRILHKLSPSITSNVPNLNPLYIVHIQLVVSKQPWVHKTGGVQSTIGVADAILLHGSQEDTGALEQLLQVGFWHPQIMGNK